MATSTLPRDYDVARILADHEARISALERRVLVLTRRAIPYRVVQGANLSVSSSVALVNTGIVINLDGLVKVDLEFRWMSGGGGIRWDWNPSGSVTTHARYVGAAGATTSGTPANTADMNWRNVTTLGTDVTIAQYSVSGVQRGTERLIVEGTGSLTFRFSQNVSNAAATEFHAGLSYAVVQRLAS